MNKNANGALARAKKLTPEQRKEISKKAVQTKKYLASLPKVAYQGDLKIGDMSFNCRVLDDGTRLILSSDIQDKFGSSGGKTYKVKENAEKESSGPLPIFVASKPLIPFISRVFDESDLIPVECNNGGKIEKGYRAEILPKVCEVWLQASDAGVLQKQQFPKVKKAEILIRGLAQVGIVALVDEATGYQKNRERDALAKILEKFVAKELQPYMKTFDADYYEEMFRLRGIKYPPAIANYRPQYFGTLTNDIVYKRLAPNILEALKSEAKKVKKNHKLFQHLTADYGRQELIKHLGTVVGLMKVSKDWDDFISLLDRVKPKIPSIKQETEEK